MQDDLFSILMHFLKHIYAFMADIQKIYSMKKIHPSPRVLQHILWKNDIRAPVKIFELNTVMYKTACAPYVVTGKLHQLAVDERKKKNFPWQYMCCMKIFIWTICLAADSLNSAIQLWCKLTGILRNTGIFLHK